MTEERIAALERRLALIEAFLDQEMRERQHFTQLRDPGSGGQINPWYGSSLGLGVHPINVGRAMPMSFSRLSTAESGRGLFSPHRL